VRDIRGHLEELYGLEVSPDLISRVTDAVLDEVKEWRARALDAVYPVVIFDALRVKIRDKISRPPVLGLEERAGPLGCSACLADKQDEALRG
jgi:transposase-like protein